MRVAPERTHSLLNVDVALVIGEEEEGIVIQEILDERAEQFGITTAQCAARYEVDRFAQGGILLRNDRADDSRVCFSFPNFPRR